MVMVMWWDGFGDWKGIKVGHGVIGVAVALKMMWWGRLWPTSRVGVTNTTKAEARSVPLGIGATKLGNYRGTTSLLRRMARRVKSAVVVRLPDACRRPEVSSANRLLQRSFAILLMEVGFAPLTPPRTLILGRFLGGCLGAVFGGPCGPPKMGPRNPPKNPPAVQSPGGVGGLRPLT